MRPRAVPRIRRAWLPARSACTNRIRFNGFAGVVLPTHRVSGPYGPPQKVAGSVAWGADACKTPASAVETRLRIFQVDAFTRTRFTGNPATVVLDADGQSDATMMSVAREFAHAEVAFVLAATAPDHDVRLRFFNARKEVPFVGHATIAAHAVLLALGRRAHGPVRQYSGTDIVEVRADETPQPTGSETIFEFRQTMP